MSRAGPPPTVLPCGETKRYSCVGALPTPTPTHVSHTEALKHSLLFDGPCTAHLVLPGKEKIIYYLLPSTSLMLINPSVYCTGEKSFQLVAT